MLILAQAVLVTRFKEAYCLFRHPSVKTLQKAEHPSSTRFLQRVSNVLMVETCKGISCGFLYRPCIEVVWSYSQWLNLTELESVWYLGKSLQSFSILGTIWEQEGEKYEYTLKITKINKSAFILNSLTVWWYRSEFLLTVETQRVFLKYMLF